MTVDLNGDAITACADLVGIVSGLKLGRQQRRNVERHLGREHDGRG